MGGHRIESFTPQKEGAATLNQTWICEENGNITCHETFMICRSETNLAQIYEGTLRFPRKLLEDKNFFRRKYVCQLTMKKGKKICINLGNIKNIKHFYQRKFDSKSITPNDV